MDASRSFALMRRLVVNKSPLILTSLAVTGVITTAILAVRGTPDALQQIAWEEEKHQVLLTNKEKALLVWRNYIPAIGTGIATISCIVGSNTISSKRNAALVSIYSMTETAFKEYRSQVVKTLGETKEQKVRDTLAGERIAKHPVDKTEVIVTGTGEQLCFDSMTARYFKSDIEAIRRAQNDINSRVINDGYASQNDFYALIGLPSATFAEEVGWNTDNMMEILFSSHLSEDGRPCLSLDYRVSPVRNYYRSY